MNKSIADYIWAFFMSVMKILLQAAAIIILGRILQPEDFGLIGMISIFIALSTMLVDSGMGASLFRKKNVKEIEYSTLFVYNMAISIFLYVLLYLIAPLIASFYNQPTLVSIIRVLSLNIIINAFSRCQYTKLLKAFKYKELSLITIFANFIAITTAIILALKGFGVWSLVFMQIIEMSITTLLYIILNRYIPSLGFSIKAFKEQFSFGVNLFGATALRTISDNIQSNIIAKIMPLNITGCFVQAQRIQHVPSLIFMSVLDKVMFPKLAIITDKDILVKKFHQTLLFVSLLAIALAFCLSQIGVEFITFILTPKWELAGKILSLLILVIIPDSLKICCRNVLKSLGYSKIILKNELFLSVTIIISIIIFSHWGIIAMISGLILSYTLGSLYIVFNTSRKLHYSMYKILLPYINHLCIYIFLYVICHFMIKYIGEQSNIKILVSVSILYLLVTLFIGYKLANKK